MCERCKSIIMSYKYNNFEDLLECLKFQQENYKELDGFTIRAMN